MILNSKHDPFESIPLTHGHLHQMNTIPLTFFYITFLLLFYYWMGLSFFYCILRFQTQIFSNICIFAYFWFTVFLHLIFKLS